jgi:hypothetical protein
MSDKTTGFEAATSEVEYEKFQFRKAEEFIGKLQFGDKPFDLENREGLELMSVVPANGLPGVVLRHRHNKLNQTSVEIKREDVYYAFHLGRADVEPMLSVLDDDLTVEAALIETGHFEEIMPLRESVAHQALQFPNDFAAVRIGGHEDIKQFMLLLHAAVGLQHVRA